MKTVQSPKSPRNTRGKTCDLCNKSTAEINCNYCSKMICSICTELTATEISSLKKGKTKLKFECKICQSGQKSDPNQSLLSVINELREQICKLEAKLDGNNNPGDQNNGNLDIDAVVNEMEERRIRSRNVIMFQIVESNETDPEKRIKHDKQKAMQILANLDHQIQENEIFVRRLGKPGNPTRPLRVTMKNERDVKNVLRKSNANKNIKNDLTPIQRNKLKELNEKLQDKIQAGEEGWTIKYVRGHPQLWRVQTPTDQNSNT
uniref:B box-type domain-containing protein n=1 Tax=Cacopsylla melanoneura TaxID=428564 RepID=A0A8D8ZFU1_9HEMI